MRQPQRLLIGLLIGLILSVTTIAVLANVPFATWNSMQPSTCLVQGMCFCETVHSDDALRQPSNTMSSLGFVLVGIVIAAAHPAHKPTRFPSIYATTFGLMSVIVGIGSAYYHASLTFIGQFFDILGMYLMASFVLIYALQRLYNWTNNRSIFIYIALNLFLTVIQIIIPDLRRYTFAIVLIIGLIVEFVYYRRRKPTIRLSWLQLGLALFTLAYGIWILDNTRLVCLPESLLQGHAVWHLLGALATGCLYLYYASESGESLNN